MTPATPDELRYLAEVAKDDRDRDDLLDIASMIDARRLGDHDQIRIFAERIGDRALDDARTKRHGASVR